MSIWRAVHVEVDTPTETAGWYVVGGPNPKSPVVLKVEGSEIDGHREEVAEELVTALNRWCWSSA